MVDLLSQELRQLRRALWLAGSAAAALLALAGVAGWQWAEAVSQRKVAEAERDRAERTLAAATRTANTMVGDMAIAFRNRADVPTDTTRKLLDRARDLQRQLTEAGEAAPELRHGEAMALGELNKTYMAQGATNSAFDAADASRKILQELIAADPSQTKLHWDLSAANDRMGNALAASGRQPEAVEAYRTSVAIMEKLVATDPGNAKWQQDLGAGYDRIGDALSAVGQREEALEFHMQAMTIRAALVQSNPDDVQRQRDLSLSYDRIGNMYVAAGQFEDALETYRKSLNIRRRLLAQDPGNTTWQRDLSISLEKVGDAFGDLGQRDDALASHEESLGLRRRIPEEGNASARTDLARSLRRTGDVLAALARVPDAIVRYDASVDTKPDIAITYRARAVALLYAGRVDAAIADLQAAVRYSPSHPYGVIWLHIARLRAGNPDARELARNAARLERGKWPSAIVDMFLGASPAESVRAGAQIARDAKARREQACEADFYIGVYQAAQNRPSESLRLFQSATDNCPPGFTEYTAAMLELKGGSAQAGAR